MNHNAKAPIPEVARQRLQADAKDIRSAARRKDVTLDSHDEQVETAAARDHFELGCWLYHYSLRVSNTGPDGLAARIDCAKRLFLAGIFSPQYDFYTVFDFGSRHFDCLVEMGDADAVIDALRQSIPDDATGRIEQAFAYHGWPLETHKAAA